MAYKRNPSDLELVQQYAMVGIPQEDIAKVLGITAKTLRKHYREELDVGAIKANAAVGGTLYRMATSGEHPACTIFWGKTKMGLREKEQQIPEDKGDIVLVRGDTRKSQKLQDEERKNGTE